MFAELELAYHNQFHKAYASNDKLKVAKKFWLHSLADLSPEAIIRGARKAMQSSAFLPTLHSIREHAAPDAAALGLPQAIDAYREACRATAPRRDWAWSHPAVYLAGRASDWFFLSSSAEQRAFPVFKRHYDALVERVMDGEQLDFPDDSRALPDKSREAGPLPASEQSERMQKLRSELKV